MEKRFVEVSIKPTALPSVQAASVASEGTWYILEKDWSLREVGNPARWAVLNRALPELSPAKLRLDQCDPIADWWRVVRVVLRRCDSNIRAFVFQPKHRHWEFLSWPDPSRFRHGLHQLFRSKRLLRTDFTLILHRLNKGTVTSTTGDAYRFATPMFSSFPVELWKRKIRKRHAPERDDDEFAPYGGVGKLGPPFAIRWRMMKRMWKKFPGPSCPDCPDDTPTFLRSAIAGFGNGIGLYFCPCCDRERRLPASVLSILNQSGVLEDSRQKALVDPADREEPPVRNEASSQNVNSFLFAKGSE